ncbi:hypothetical protein ACN38_g4121 [Penicillium nordicum]|uniref:Uncharacterized protein n=1 Tax=Penicillium nordicum TaxID=229535 RepID=A0A0M8PB29_9EURO|nr:hypothetical protein ACN38_g4121 [Penicillium nordicum]
MQDTCANPKSPVTMSSDKLEGRIRGFRLFIIGSHLGQVSEESKVGQDRINMHLGIRSCYQGPIILTYSTS